MRAIKNARVQYQDQTLVRYERAVQDKLRNLMELLETGDAHLGFDKRVWIPDDTAEVEFTLMEGITDPIIVVNVRYQAGKGGGEKREKKKYYSPYLWVGITAINHTNTGDDNNPNCPYAGTPVNGHLLAFEPLGDKPPTFREVASTMPPWWSVIQEQSRIGNIGDCEMEITAGSSWFGWQTWNTTFYDGAGNLVAHLTDKGMIGTEGCSTKVTLPPDALRPAEEGGDPLDEDYWHRSIIVDPDGTEFPEEKQDCVYIYDIPGDADVPGGATATFTCKLGVGVVPCEVVSGDYEIQAWAESFPCECWGATLHMRMVLGKGADTEETVYDAETNEPLETIYGREPAITVVDFYPETGRTPDDTRGWLVRELSIGGDGPCGAYGSFVNADGPFNPNRGFWLDSLLVSVNAGTWRLSGDRSVVPPITDDQCPNHTWPASSECGVECSPTPFGGAVYAPATWDLGGPSEAMATRGQFTTLLAGQLANANLYDFLQGMLARVTSVREDGSICGVQIVGNDGGSANPPCGGCAPFGYGLVISGATGLRGDATIVGNEIIGGQVGTGFSVGELVWVAGAGGVTSVPFTYLQQGEKVTVKAINDFSDFDPLGQYAAEQRCPTGASMQKRFKDMETALANRVTQTPGAGAVIGKFECQDGRMMFLK